MNKNTGSYYTPSYLTDFITNQVLSNFKKIRKLSILEPSVGNGAFLKSIKRNCGNRVVNLTACEINKEEINKAKKNWNNNKSTFINKDFLKHNFNEKFQIVIGNPPYIKRNLLDSKQLEACKEIHLKAGLSNNSIKNIWTSFLIKSTNLLAKNGLLALVLPSELLQVNFTKEIRAFLQLNFQRVEIFTFGNLMFDCKGQDTILVFGFNKSNKKGIFFTNIDESSDLLGQNFTLRKNDALINSEIKWSHHLLSTEELELLNKAKKNLYTINHYCDSKPGIVTAANNFFIIDNQTEKKYELENYTLPIIQKGHYVNGSVVFDKKDYQELSNSGLPSKFIHFKNEHKGKMSKSVLTYLKMGKTQNIDDRYKCKKRQNWFVVPNVSRQSQGFFFRRSHLYPKILRNSADAFVTDSAYKIDLKNGYNINSLIYSFYNSLTLAFAEIEGRYYGGGVLELVPSEFKKLPIPYLKISTKEFNQYRKSFEKKENIESILKDNDYRILNSVLQLSKSEIQQISSIRQKLFNKRLKNKISQNQKNQL